MSVNHNGLSPSGKLTPEAKSAVFSYMLSIFTVGGILVAIIAGIAGFMIKDLATKTAVTDALTRIHAPILDASMEVAQILEATKRLSMDVQQLKVYAESDDIRKDIATRLANDKKFKESVESEINDKVNLIEGLKNNTESLDKKIKEIKPTIATSSSKLSRIETNFDDFELKLNEKMSKKDFKIMLNESISNQEKNFPIGSIIAWHRDLKKNVKLPKNWVECNGQKIMDKESPYRDMKAPNLNIAKGYSAGRFLRGGKKSGLLQEGTAHFAKTKKQCLPNPDKEEWVKESDGSINKKVKVLSATRSQDKEDSRFDRSRPVNMTVIWIFKIK